MLVTTSNQRQFLIFGSAFVSTALSETKLETRVDSCLWNPHFCRPVNHLGCNL